MGERTRGVESVSGKVGSLLSQGVCDLGLLHNTMKIKNCERPQGLCGLRKNRSLQQTLYVIISLGLL